MHHNKKEDFIVHRYLMEAIHSGGVVGHSVDSCKGRTNHVWKSNKSNENKRHGDPRAASPIAVWLILNLFVYGVE